MSPDTRRFITPAIVIGSMLVAFGVAAGIGSRLAGLGHETAQTIRVVGLAAAFVGALFLGFAWLIGTATRVPIQGAQHHWTTYPVVGFSLGVLAGNLYFDRSFPASLIGLIVGLFMGWRSRRAA